MARRDDKLVAIAEFGDRGVAEQAWSVLNDAGVAAAVLADPDPFGASPVFRIEVARRDAAEAQRLIVGLVDRP
jgi:hypothetical protein